MNNFFRKRYYYLVGGSALVILFMYLTDPNGGAITTMLAAQLATPILAVLFAHLMRKALFDYANMLDLYRKALESPIGAAIVYASMCGILFALLGLFGGQVRAQIPDRAFTYLPEVQSQQKLLWPDHPKPF